MLVERFFVPPSPVMRVRLGWGMQGGSGQPHGSPPRLRAPESLPSLIMALTPQRKCWLTVPFLKDQGCLLGTSRASTRAPAASASPRGPGRRTLQAVWSWADPQPLQPGHSPSCIWRTGRCPAGSQVAHFSPGTAELPTLSLWSPGNMDGMRCQLLREATLGCELGHPPCLQPCSPQPHGNGPTYLPDVCVCVS